eukprot:TRINITY_DN9222_c0_g1_i1.p1 TRINITY_DN9222_c0_g1~~TRINITY_DN9222_c0_g1_i1.p1  ORF type:complete len:121 (-),score=21.84 TRINITY_DN9222_c0_g1_i1:205-540(-)
MSIARFAELAKNFSVGSPTHSGVQLEVLRLYRQFVRVAKAKPEATRAQTLATVRRKFREGAQIPRTQYERIEYYLEVGHRRLKMLSADEIRSVSTFTFTRPGPEEHAKEEE